jgi:glycosyltransferase involved in cell wall biosynthesis
MPSIAVVIPAYKVERQIAKVVGNIPALVEKIIFVNDASPDQTGKVLASLDDPRLVVVSYDKNRGVGGAMMCGYDRAIEEGADILVKMDGDDQMDPDYILSLVRPILAHQADFTKGNRFLNQTQMQKMPLIRRIGNWGLTFLVKASSGYWKIFDPSNGFTAMHADVWKQIDQNRIAKDYFFESSLLIELRYHNAVVKDVSIPARYQDEESSLSVTHVLFSFPGRLLKAFIRRVIFQYYLFDFSFVSVSLLLGGLALLFGFIWGIWHWHISRISGIPATTGTVLIAVLPVILGAQLWLQAVAEDMRDIPKEPIHSADKDAI